MWFRKASTLQSILLKLPRESCFPPRGIFCVLSYYIALATRLLRKYLSDPFLKSWASQLQPIVFPLLRSATPSEGRHAQRGKNL